MRPLIWIGHVELKTQSIKQAEQFYVGLGLRLIISSDDFLILELRGGTHLILSEDQNAEPADAGFDFMVEDIDGAHATYTKLGCTISELSRGKIHDSFELTDPSGNKIKVNSTHVEDHELV